MGQRGWQPDSILGCSGLRWRLAPDFVTPPTSLHELPGPVEREADSWIRKPRKWFDVDDHRSMVGNQQDVRYMLAHSPIDLCLQEKWLHGDTAHCTVEIRIHRHNCRSRETLRVHRQGSRSPRRDLGIRNYSPNQADARAPNGPSISATCSTK